MNLGNFALALAFASGLIALPLYFFWARGHVHLKRQARLFTGIMALSIFVASAFQMYNILAHQFQYEYVANFSDRQLPTLLLAATFWGGQSGSFMLWSLWSALFALILIIGLRRSSWEPYVLTPYLLIVSCIVGIMWASGPFRMLPQTPDDGQGLNPLLQNYWMAIHPPILFTGFTTMAGPFAFAVAALWRRDYDGWVKMAHPWVLLAWICMGAGLSLGGFWAYASLGWGGFWGWDPVENSSLVPWLFAGALLHGLVMQRSRGSMKRANLALAVFGYLMVIYSTFLTRSGILGKFSVHSFVELGLMGYLVVFIVGFALLGFGLLAWRWRDIPRRVAYTHVLSRSFGLIISMTLLVAVALIVGIGTSMPVISLLPVFSSQASVDLSFYEPTVGPFGLLLLLSMAVFPLLGWRGSTYGSLLHALKWPAILSGVTVFLCLLLNIIYPVALLLIGGAVFVMSANMVMIRRIWHTGPLKIGGYLAHVGVGLLTIGIVGNAYYKQTAALHLTQNVPQIAFGRQFTFRGMVLPPDDPLKRTALQVEVTDPQTKRTWVTNAPYYVYPKTGQLVIHPGIQSGLWSDLYVAPSQYFPPAQIAPGQVVLDKGAPVSLLGYTLTFQQFDLPNRDAMLRGESPARVNARVAVTAPDGSTAVVTPTVRLAAGQGLQGDPVGLPGGATLTMLTLDPNNQFITVQLGGMDLSKVNPDDLKARAFLDISTEPAIKFAWAGIITAAIGGALALLRRRREGRPTLEPAGDPAPAPMPRRERPVLQPGIAPIISSESEGQA